MKPCPSCDNEDVHVTESGTFWWGACGACFTMGPSVKTKAEAEATWDALPRRHDLPLVTTDLDYTASNGSTYWVTFIHHGPKTIALVEWQGKRRMAHFAGLAACHPNDNYDQKIGDRLALKNALQIGEHGWRAIRPDIAREIWSEYRKAMRLQADGESVAPEIKRRMKKAADMVPFAETYGDNFEV